MKRIALFLVFISISFSLVAQKGRIIFFRGTIGKYLTQMTLQLPDSGKEVSGFYQYEGKQAWLKLSGTSADGRNLVLNEFPQDGSKNENQATTGTFTGQLSKENLFAGKWVAANGKTTLEFKMHAECGTEGVCFKMQEAKADTTMYSQGHHEKGIEISAEVKWLESNSGNNTLDAWLDTFIFNRLYSPEMIETYRITFPDYSAIADSFMLDNINYDSQMYLSTSCDVTWNGNGILCLESGWWEYTGGAHGNGFVEYNCFDLQSGKLLTTDDIFKKGYEEPLRLKAVEHLDRDPDFFSRDSLELNGNFYITPEGIGFFYNSYEITAYVNGQPVAFIPWKEMEQLVDPKGPMNWVKK
ncbi:hypothetical protein BH11BAC7_BH11BAC7_26950 [soil metagenome]